MTTSKQREQGPESITQEEYLTLENLKLWITKLVAYSELQVVIWALLPLVALLVPAGEQFLGLSVDYWLKANFLYPMASNVLILGILYKKYSIKDYRFQITAHLIGITTLVRINTAVNDGLQVLGFSEADMITWIVGSVILLAFFSVVINIVSLIRIPVKSLENDINQVAIGNLNIEPKGLVVYGSEYGNIEIAFHTMLENNRYVVGNIKSAAERLATSAEEFSSSTEEINASSEEISSVIQQMNRGAQQQAEQINATVSNVQTLSEIAKKTTQDITSTVDLITDVASQTNMLSLNAQIEAARAGDFGKSFMVVADNVRRLAEDTKTGANNVQELVTSIQQQISTSVEKIAKSVDSVAAVAEETAASSEEASAATEEQTSTMEEMSASSQELARLAQELLNSVKVFKMNEKEGKTIVREKVAINSSMIVEETNQKPLISRIGPLIRRKNNNE
ncbi:MAG: methyl-accepting chemotaxis protein [Candidatus Hodarchaeales archaeon]|jgi:methyl-accepting chemotaxis protein